MNCKTWLVVDGLYDIVLNAGGNNGVVWGVAACFFKTICDMQGNSWMPSHGLCAATLHLLHVTDNGKLAQVDKCQLGIAKYKAKMP